MSIALYESGDGALALRRCPVADAVRCFRWAWDIYPSNLNVKFRRKFDWMHEHIKELRGHVARLVLSAAVRAGAKPEKEGA